MTGTVKEIRVKEGQKIKVGQVIFTVENGAGAKVKAAEPKAETKAPGGRRARSEARSTSPRKPSETRPAAPAVPLRCHRCQRRN